MTTPENALRARRKLSNKAIAARATAALSPCFTPDAVLIAGDGAPIFGRAAILEAFAAQFQDRAFTAYVRETDRVVFDAEGARAAEYGRWTGLWDGAVRTHGEYMAVWRKDHGQWLIERELYFSLA